MRIRLSAAILGAVTSLLLMVGVEATPIGLGDTSQRRGPQSLEPVRARWLSDRLLELTFANPLTNPPLKKTKVRVLVPDDFRSSGGRYPAILLLHGGGDDSSAWTEKQDGWPITLEEFTEDKDVIVIMPDGGKDENSGWYSNWYNSGEFGPPKWHTYHIEQLLPYIKRNFPVRRDRNGWVVAGLSMGGFGTMSYAARHPDLFAGAFSFSGALDLRVAGYALQVPLLDVWGDRATNEIYWRGHNPADLAGNLDHAKVWFRTGMGVPGGPAPLDNHPVGVGIEAAVWESNETFKQALEEQGVDYAYLRYAQGAHNWYHWHQGLQEFAWPVIEDIFERGVDRPDAWDYRTIERDFSIWDWRVHVRREAMEFLELRWSGTTLALRGSGTVDLKTPSLFQPGSTYRIVVRGKTARAKPAIVMADSGGRLSFSVALGPPHTLKQDTAEQRVAEAANPDYWQHAIVRFRNTSRE